MMGSAAKDTSISSWPGFARSVRPFGKLLKELHRFPDAVLVTGCQRSGTTAVARMISSSKGMRSHWVSRDDELDGALILSGERPHPGPGRYCFQTTYLNESFHEYFTLNDGVKIIWVLRNPYSVVYSMAYNWRRFALNELFMACGRESLTGRKRYLVDRFGTFIVPKLEKACLAYNGKLNQLAELEQHFGPEQLMVIDYDQLVLQRAMHLPRLYDFIGLPFHPAYLDKINSRSLKKAEKMAVAQRRLIERLSGPVYAGIRDRHGLTST